MILPFLFIAPSSGRGRGVFTAAAIDANTVIEIAPVIVMSAADRVLLDQTALHDYIFEWGAEQQQVCMALGYVPVYNHAASANCEYLMDYLNDQIQIHTVRQVEAGEELFINYNGAWNDATPVWFATT